MAARDVVVERRGDLDDAIVLDVQVEVAAHPAIGAHRSGDGLARLVVWKRATELLFTGELVSAKAAAEMGMINWVTPDDELMSRAMAMAEKLAQAPTAAIAEIKKLLEASATNDLRSHLDLERETQIESGKTKDFVEGVSAFLEKRPPRFVGG